MRRIVGTIGLIAMIAVTWLLALHAKEAEIGKPAPDFVLTDIKGKEHSLSDYQGSYVVLEWVNHGCPFVKKHYKSNNMQTLQKELREKDVVWLSICSSAKGRQGYFNAKKWKKVVKRKRMNSTAVLLDPDGKVGKTFGAKTTPHMFIVDPEGNLIYRGAIDDKPSTDVDDIEGSKNFVRLALEEALAGEKVTYSSTRSYGCSVKYE